VGRGVGVIVGVDVGVGLGVTVCVNVAVAVGVALANGFGRLATWLHDSIAAASIMPGTNKKIGDLRSIM